MAEGVGSKPEISVQSKDAKVRVSMLSRGSASAGASGLTNAVSIDLRAHPSRLESKVLMSVASLRVMAENQNQRWSGL